MTLKKLFEKLESYNEVAELMNTRKAHIYFTTYSPEFKNIRFGEAFSYYEEFRKYIRKEYIKETADFILKSDGWNFDKEVTFTRNDPFFGDDTNCFCPELAAD